MSRVRAFALALAPVHTQLFDPADLVNSAMLAALEGNWRQPAPHLAK